MKLIIVGGPPSSGKTSVIIHSINSSNINKKKVAVFKLDCLVANDYKQYKKNNIRTITGLSVGNCPDHFLATNIERIAKYGLKNKLEHIIVESAGLCNRCSPHLKNYLGVTVLDVLSGIQTPQKIGPMLKAADLIVLTKSDLISQAEREVFTAKVRLLNRKATIINVNGLTGQNSQVAGRFFSKANDYDDSIPLSLKYAMPGAVCSFCLGEKRAGETYASGNVKLMEIKGF